MSETEFAAKRSSGKRKVNRTITTTRRSWFHLGHDGRLHVVNQKFGQPTVGQVTLTRAEFEQFVRFYKKARRITR